MRSICCPSPGRRKLSRSSRIASLTGFWNGQAHELKRKAYMRWLTSLKLNRRIKARSTSMFSCRAKKSPRRRLSIREQLLRNRAKLFGRSTEFERSEYMSLFSSKNDSPTLGLALNLEAPVRTRRLRDFACKSSPGSGVPCLKKTLTNGESWFQIKHYWHMSMTRHSEKQIDKKLYTEELWLPYPRVSFRHMTNEVK